MDLATARRAAGLSRADVASSLARCTATVERWENGQHMPSEAVVQRLALLYGVSAHELQAGLA